VDDAAEERLGHDARDAADADADEGEAGNAGAPASVLGKDDGICYEAEVEDSIDDGDPRV